MNNQKSQSEYLYNILYTLFKRKYLAAAIFITTFAGIIFGTYLVTPSWKATAKVRVQYNPKQQLTMFEGITTPGAVVPGVNPANDVIQILTSRELAENVVKRFGRDKLWEKRINAPESTREIITWHIKDFLVGKPVRLLQSLGILSKNPDNYLAMAVEELQEDLEDIALEENTTVANVSVWGESPEISTSMANSLVQLLIEKNHIASKTPVDKMIKSTEKQFAVAKNNLGVAQENLRKFKEKSGLVSYNEEASIFLQRLDKYEAELNSMVGQMESMKIDKNASHPEIKSLEARINEYRHIIIPGIKKNLSNLPVKEVEITKLNQELKAREDLYSTLQMKILELGVLQNSTIGDLGLTVVDPARVYSYVKPDWPRWVINLPLGLFASLFVSLLFVFFLEYWNTSFKSVKETEENIPLPVLGSISKFGFFRKKKLLTTLTEGVSRNPHSNLPLKISDYKNIESLTPYDPITGSIFLNCRMPAGKLFLITSPGNGEGKSLIAVILGRILSIRGKRVLLIEANLRTPSLERILNAKGNRGILDYYSANSKLEDVIESVNGLDVIFAGNLNAHHPDPVELFASERMETLLRETKTRYDFVLIDSPCIKWFKETFVLSTLSDGVIIIIEANKTPKRAVIMATEKINSVGAHIEGIILNKQTNYVPDLFQNFLY